MLKALVFGTGEYYRNIRSKIVEKYEIVGFLTNDQKMINTEMDGVAVYHPQYAGDITAVVIIIASMYHVTMFRQLLSLHVNKPILPGHFFQPMEKNGETGRARNSLAQFCVGDGVDIGYGGYPICETAICIDMPTPYTSLARSQEYPQHLHGDATRLYWFNDDSLDYVYSSHLLEDFVDTKAVFKEWLRIIKPGGVMVLYLPDEQDYRKSCSKRGVEPNGSHVHMNFGLNYMKSIVMGFKNAEIIHELYPSGSYSFELVVRKI